MDKKTLLTSAGNLKQVSASAYSEFNIKGDQLVAKMNELMLQRADLHLLKIGRASCRERV